MKNKEQPSNFWFGFALGTIAAVGTSYLLGTKNGRDLTKKLLDITENFEENFEIIKSELKKELNEDPESHTESENLQFVAPSHSAQAETQTEKHRPLTDVLHKISSLTSHFSSEPKKFIK